MRLTEKLAYLKKRDGLTAALLAQRAGVSPGTLNKILCGVTRHPSLDVMVKIADVFRVPVRYLCDDTESRSEFEMTALVKDSGESITIRRSEAELLKRFRGLTPREQEKVDGMISTFYQLYERLPSGCPTLALCCYYILSTGSQGAVGKLVNHCSVLVQADETAQSSDFCVSLHGAALEPLYKAGTVLGVKRRAVREGELGVFLLNGEGVVRRYSGRRGVRRLVTLNSHVPNLRICAGDDLQCLGVVTGPLHMHGPPLTPPRKG